VHLLFECVVARAIWDYVNKFLVVERIMDN
jgi:hypothetical protein